MRAVPELLGALEGDAGTAGGWTGPIVGALVAVVALGALVIVVAGVALGVAVVPARAPASAYGSSFVLGAGFAAAVALVAASLGVVVLGIAAALAVMPALPAPPQLAVGHPLAFVALEAVALSEESPRVTPSGIALIVPACRPLLPAARTINPTTPPIPSAAAITNAARRERPVPFDRATRAAGTTIAAPPGADAALVGVVPARSGPRTVAVAVSIVAAGPLSRSRARPSSRGVSTSAASPPPRTMLGCVTSLLARASSAEATRTGTLTFPVGIRGDTPFTGSTSGTYAATASCDVTTTTACESGGTSITSGTGAASRASFVAIPKPNVASPSGVSPSSFACAS